MGPSSQGGNVFFAKYGGPSGGSPLLGGGIIILRVIRSHFLAAAVDPAVSLSTYSPRLIEVFYKLFLCLVHFFIVTAQFL